MIIVLDVGNTNTKIGIFDGDTAVRSLRLSSSVNQTSDEYGFYLVNMLKDSGIRAEDITGGIISSVNPNLNYTFEHMLEYYFHIKPYIVGAGIKTGINIKYDNPKEVGSDRIVGCVAAYNLYGGPCVVIDCGTATTFNVVSEKGDFLGGAIAAGLKASSSALFNGTAKLPKVELVAPKTIINKTTITNMQGGLVYGYVSMVEGIIGRIRREFGKPLRVIATGGLSEIVAAESNVIDVVDRSLTLKGLNVIYRLQQNKTV